MSQFAGSSEAFRVARERRSVAAAIEDRALHMAICDARNDGMSIREAAAALLVPKSTVARHWREGHRCVDAAPTWGSPEAWREAHYAVWAHDPLRQRDDWVPYEWRDGSNGRRIITLRGRGPIRFDGAGNPSAPVTQD
jgi:hypothetical protein